MRAFENDIDGLPGEDATMIYRRWKEAKRLVRKNNKALRRSELIGLRSVSDNLEWIKYRREQKALRRLDKQMARRRNKEDDRYEFLRRKLSFEDQRRMGKFDWLITSVAIAGIAYFLGHLAAWVVR